MTMHKAVNPGDDIDIVYVPRKERRELTSIEDCENATIQGFKEYTRISKEKLITAITNNNGNVRSNRTTKSRK